MRRRGFTLMELALVLSVIGVLTALAVPSLQGVMRRARAAEARTLMEAIAHAELAYFRDHGKYLACTSPAPPPGGATAFGGGQACWEALGVKVDGHVRYRYEVALAGPSFTVTAEGDLDGDGLRSRFVLDGATLRLQVTEELE